MLIMHKKNISNKCEQKHKIRRKMQVLGKNEQIIKKGVDI